MKVIGFRLSLVSVALSSAVALVGCGGGPEGPELGQVSGTVTLDGKPVEAGYVVEFVPHTEEGTVDSDKNPSSGTTDESGRYELKYGGTERKGAIVGRHGVTISNARDMNLPPAYSSGDETARAFWANVESGSQEIDIPLDSAPAPGQIDLKKK